MTAALDVDDVALNFDPSEPQARFRDQGLEAALAAPEALLPEPAPWPTGAAPSAAPFAAPPPETADLSVFRGYDAVVVTWTVAEAVALASLMTPGWPLSTWYSYRHGEAAYRPGVTGAKAPFNSLVPDMARYRHSLGLYMPCRIGAARVLLFKSGLHLSYDGRGVPVHRLITEIAGAVAPRRFITTGAGGGVGPDVAMGDVIIAGAARFHCRGQFASARWANESYPSSPLPAGALDAITSALTGANAARIPGARPAPRLFCGRSDRVVTTDAFAFDDSTGHFGLQGLGRVCEMADAMVGNALQAYPDTAWHSVRAVSDAQSPGPADDVLAAGQRAAQSYGRYGAIACAASVVACWAIIQAASC